MLAVALAITLLPMARKLFKKKVAGGRSQII